MYEKKIGWAFMVIIATVGIVVIALVALENTHPQGTLPTPSMNTALTTRQLLMQKCPQNPNAGDRITVGSRAGYKEYLFGACEEKKTCDSFIQDPVSAALLKMSEPCGALHLKSQQLVFVNDMWIHTPSTVEKQIPQESIEEVTVKILSIKKNIGGGIGLFSTTPVPIENLNSSIAIDNDFILDFSNQNIRDQVMNALRNIKEVDLKPIDFESSVLLNIRGANNTKQIVDILNQENFAKYISQNTYVNINEPSFNIQSTWFHTSLCPSENYACLQNLCPNREPNRVPNYGKGVTVYILDTGIYEGHSMFGTHREQGRIKGESVVPNASPEDDHGHGTHIAGIIAYCSPGASIESIRVMGPGGSSTQATILEGLELVRKKHIERVKSGKLGLSVLNLSLGSRISDTTFYNPRTDLINQAVRDLVCDNITVIAAAGNDQEDACFNAPANAIFSNTGQCNGRYEKEEDQHYKSLIPAVTVGALNRIGLSYTSFSNVGRCVDISAVGDDIISASIRGPQTYIRMSGTSMAAPIVAATAANIASIFYRAFCTSIDPMKMLRHLHVLSSNDEIAQPYIDTRKYKIEERNEIIRLYNEMSHHHVNPFKPSLSRLLNGKYPCDKAVLET